MKLVLCFLVLLGSGLNAQAPTFSYPFALSTHIPDGAHPGVYPLRLQRLHEVEVGLEYVPIDGYFEPYAMVRYVDGLGNIAYRALDNGHTLKFVAQ